MTALAVLMLERLREGFNLVLGKQEQSLLREVWRRAALLYLFAKRSLKLSENSQIACAIQYTATPRENCVVTSLRLEPQAAVALSGNFIETLSSYIAQIDSAACKACFTFGHIYNTRSEVCD